MKLRKLSDAEMIQVSELANAMRDQDKDKYNLGRAIIYFTERNRVLENVFVKADYFLRFGMGTTELTALRMAVEEVRELDEDVNEDSSMFI